ncbi:MAG: hypothetical protein HY255_11240 [Betaproteobacteria bacterium]|nr:hypothetical protein [Betaproteobacteria bacterium]
MTKKSDPLPKLTPAELALVKQFNDDPAWTRDKLLSTLKEVLQVAIQVELSTIPIYLYTYYSLQRTQQATNTGAETIYTPVQLFANQAGGRIMSIAVEEMLHMSLSSNILYAVGGKPEVYLKSPGAYPTNLLDHAVDGPDGQPLEIPLAKFSFQQLWYFLEIEYPESADAIPQDNNWTSLGQVYAYIRCIISSDKLGDKDFQQGKAEHQIQPENYSPSNIDTVYPDANFNATLAPAQPDSAAHHARSANADDSHAGYAELMTIHSKHQALAAIATVTDQGEGTNNERWDDPKKLELSHYFKFLALQAQLQGYPGTEPLAAKPKAPPPAATLFSPGDLAGVVYNFPDNPTTADYPAPLSDVSNFCNGLYQYMLILTETTFKVPGRQQKAYFNRALHLTMIWMLDKLVQQMAQTAITDGKFKGMTLAPTFENYSLGSRAQAYANLVALGSTMSASNPGFAWVVSTYITNGTGVTLPDVSSYWSDNPYADIPMYPTVPPTDPADPHACMGLNSCKGRDRFGPQGHPGPSGVLVQNDCAGQGYCSTTADHTCHVLNSCAGQGGCGLYGTAEEQNKPGLNECQSLGSCATPINAERFSTDGPNQGKSVWLRAREVFREHRWPDIARERGLDPHRLPEPPHPELFANGPTFAWVSQNPNGGMTACGSSGMSGAGSCA